MLHTLIDKQLKSKVKIVVKTLAKMYTYASVRTLFEGLTHLENELPGDTSVLLLAENEVNRPPDSVTVVKLKTGWYTGS